MLVVGCCAGDREPRCVVTSGTDGEQLAAITVDDGRAGSDGRCAGNGTSTVAASIAIYRPQAECFGGRCDAKFIVRLEKE